MNNISTSLKKSLSFGITSAVITTSATAIGLFASTGSPKVVLVGILTIAFADSMSDAMGIHLLEESDQRVSDKSLFKTTALTFVVKLFASLTFAIPILLFDIGCALIIIILWATILLIALSYYLAKNRKKSVISTISEHLVIGFLVVFLSYIIGRLLESAFL